MEAMQAEHNNHPSPQPFIKYINTADYVKKKEQWLHFYMMLFNILEHSI